MNTISKLIHAGYSATMDRKVVRYVAQGKEVPEIVFPFNNPEKFASNIEKVSGKYSKNPIKKITSWFKQFSAILNNMKNFKNTDTTKQTLNIEM